LAHFGTPRVAVANDERRGVAVTNDERCRLAVTNGERCRVAVTNGLLALLSGFRLSPIFSTGVLWSRWSTRSARRSRGTLGPGFRT